MKRINDKKISGFSVIFEKLFKRLSQKIWQISKVALNFFATYIIDAY